MEQDHKYGIQILSFDRPDYLEPVLEGLKNIGVFND